MSDFKIVGNANPVVGEVEHYTVNNLYPKIVSGSNFSLGSAPVQHQIKWEVYLLELGKWRKTKENDKTGNLVTYKFRHGSLTRAGIRIAAIKGDETAWLDIKPLPSKPKIDDVRLLDKSGKKIDGRLSYGQTVKARVHCLHMEKRRIYVTLWEDDVKGAGHNKANETNFIETKSGIVRDGIADIDFLLKPSFAKIAAKNGLENDNVHEYYVTAQLDQEKVPSNNVNVNAPEAPTAPYKAKTTPKKEPVKSNAPVKETKTKTSETAKAVKGKINSVNLTDTAGHKIKGKFKEKQIKVWINSTGLIGKEVRLKLYDEDLFSNDLLFTHNFTIQSDLHAIVVSLDSIPRSLGGDNWAEGNEQELFAEIEVLQTHDFSKSAVVDVDATVFKQDPVEKTNKVLKVDEGKDDKKGKDKGVCVCKEYDLIWGNKVSCEFRKKVIEIAKNLGLPEKKNEGANWLMAVMALETGRTFSPTCGTFKKHKDDTKNGYVGLIQIGKVASIDLGVKRSELIKLSATVQLDYVEKFFKQKKFDGKLKTKTDLYLAVNYPNACGHGTEKDYVVYDSTKDAYDDNPMFNREKDEYWIDKKGKKHYYEGRVGSSYVWEFEEAINDFYNEGLEEKVTFFGTCSVILNSVTDKDVVTYNIYSDGKIEKIIPKEMKKGYENKYKYVYHDKNKKNHPVCILDWYNTKEKATGVVYNSKPTHNEILSDEKVSEGDTSRRVKYKNGDIAEYGKHPTKGLIWRLYKSTGNEIELIKMPDNLNYARDGIVIKYNFSQTKRRYTGPNPFAGFIGALAECSYFEGIITTGSCFKEGSCFPSAEHVNGKSVDTIYYKDLKKDQAFVDAVIKFKFSEVLVGNNQYCKQIKNAGDGGSLHNSHLHSGNFENSNVVIKK